VHDTGWYLQDQSLITLTLFVGKYKLQVGVVHITDRVSIRYL
jgi:hypothetical protein